MTIRKEIIVLGLARVMVSPKSGTEIIKNLVLMSRLVVPDHFLAFL